MYDERENHDEARHLLAPLASQPAGPSRVDLQRAIADGRRRVRTRQLAGVGAIGAVITLAVAGIPVALAAILPPDPPLASTPVPTAPTVTSDPSPTAFPVPSESPEPAPEPPTQCQLELPPVPAEALASFAFGTDPTGRIVYGRYFHTDDAGREHAQPVLWIDGELTPVDIPGNDAHIDAVNSSGVAVGGSVVGSGEADHPVAWIYQDGEVTQLAGDDAEPVAITEDGVVLGMRAATTTGVVWRSPDAPPEDLPTPGYSGLLIMSGIMPDGTLVGFRVGSRERSFVWWPDGTIQDIPLPEFGGERYGFRAKTFNGRLLIGEATLLVEDDGRNRSYAAAFDLATGQFTLLSEDAPIFPWAMNRHGWVAGEVDGHAGLWTPEGGLVPLPDLGTGYEFAQNLPHWITDDGRTLAGVVDLDGRSRAAIWRCD